MQIDINRDRDALGISRSHMFPTGLKIFFCSLIISVLIGGLGVLMGNSVRRQTAEENNKRLIQMYNAYPSDAAVLLEEIRSQSGNNAYSRYILSRAYNIASEVLPEREILLNQSLFEAQAAIKTANILPPSEPDNSWDESLDDRGLFTGMDELTEKEYLHLRMHISGLLLDVGKDKQALEEVEPLEYLDIEKYFMAESYNNLIAYIMASAQDKNIRDGAQALKLAKTVVDDPENCYEPAYLDTLAEAYFACGQPEKAVKIQKRALGLAFSQNLWIYIKHFEKYKKAALLDKDK